MRRGAHADAHADAHEDMHVSVRANARIARRRACVHKGAMRELLSTRHLACALPIVTIALFIGCNDNDTTTTVITASGDPTPATGPTVPDPTEGGATTGVDSAATTVATGPDINTSAMTATSTNSDTSTPATGPDDTTDGNFTCWPEGLPEACGAEGACDALFTCDADVCSCAVLVAKGADFCGVVHALASEAGVTEPYLGFVDNMCTSGEDRCVVCFNLQNYCDLLAGSCENLYTACGCVGDFYGVP